MGQEKVAASPVCEVCGATMLHYENPAEWKCPRRARHLLYWRLGYLEGRR